MNDQFEKELQSALRPIDPGTDFTAAVMEKTRDSLQIAAPPTSTRGLSSPLRWLSAGIAASLVVAVIAVTEVREQREREAGMRAKAQVIEALNMTSAKLKLAYRVIHEQSDGDKRKSDSSQRDKDHSGV